MSLTLGKTRQRISKFSGVTLHDLITGFIINEGDENTPISYRWSFATNRVGRNGKDNYGSGLVSLNEEQHNSFIQHLGLNTSNFVESENNFLAIVDKDGNKAPLKQERAFGFTLNEKTFNTDCVLRAYLVIQVGTINSMYYSKSKGCVVIGGEAATRKGIKSFEDSNGNLHAAYTSYILEWSDTKDKNGKKVANTSMVEAAKMATEADQEGTIYKPSKKFISPFELLEMYKGITIKQAANILDIEADKINSIDFSFLQGKVNDDVFTEVEEPAFDYGSVDIDEMSTPDLKVFYKDHKATLGLPNLPKKVADIRNALTEGIKEYTAKNTIICHNIVL